MKKILIIIVLILCFSCNRSQTNNHSEYSIIEEISISKSSDNIRYYILTNEYNFYTDKNYRVGDTIKLININYKSNK